jgi:cytochrome bd-type quinol oxidase subunit 2
MKTKTTIFSVVALCLVLAPGIVLGAGLTTVDPFLGTARGEPIGAIRSLVNGLLVLVGIVAAIFVIIGGARYIFSQGDEDAQVQARNTIIYALIGVIIIILAAVLVNFVINAIPNRV